MGLSSWTRTKVYLLNDDEREREKKGRGGLRAGQRRAGQDNNDKKER